MKMVTKTSKTTTLARKENALGSNHSMTYMGFGKHSKIGQ
jgi:hypothetical protein